MFSTTFLKGRVGMVACIRQKMVGSRCIFLPLSLVLGLSAVIVILDDWKKVSCQTSWKNQKIPEGCSNLLPMLAREEGAEQEGESKKHTSCFLRWSNVLSTYLSSCFHRLLQRNMESPHNAPREFCQINEILAEEVRGNMLPSWHSA